MSIDEVPDRQQIAAWRKAARSASRRISTRRLTHRSRMPEATRDALDEAQTHLDRAARLLNIYPDKTIWKNREQVTTALHLVHEALALPTRR